MTRKSPTDRGWIRAVCILTLAVLTACANAQTDPTEERWGVHRYKRIEWQEQVRLSTGRVIVVKRGERARLAYGGELPFGWLFDEGWIEADLAGVGRTRWEGSLSPLVLDVTPGGEWYLLGVIGANKGRREYALSRGKWYAAFKLSGTAWRRVPFAQFPDSFKPNLLANTHRLFWKESTPSGTLVTFEMKHRVDSNPTLGREYRIIDRSLGE